MCLIGCHHGRHNPGADHSRRDWPGAEDHLVALCLRLRDGGRVRHGGRDDRGGDEMIKCTRDVAQLRHCGQHRRHQRCQSGRVPVQQLDGLRHQLRLSLHHGAGEGHNLNTAIEKIYFNNSTFACGDNDWSPGSEGSPGICC